VRRPIQFFHLPVPKPRTDDAYFAPLAGLKSRPEAELYPGLVHRDDMAGDVARFAAARRHVRVDGWRPIAIWRAAIARTFRRCLQRTRRPPDWLVSV